MKPPAIALCVEKGLYRFSEHESRVPPLLITQIEKESSFFIGDWFTRHCEMPALVFDATCDEFPDVNKISSLIISGSHHMIDDGYLWISRLEELVRKCIKKSLPVLGICFGHQLLSKLLGGQVSNIKKFMIGPKALILTKDAREDWLFTGLPDNFPVLYSRKQAVISVPPSVERLDTGSPFIDAIAFRDNIRGVQFHPELDCVILSYALHIKKHILQAEGVDIKAVMSALQNYSTDFSTRILRNFMRISKIPYIYKKGLP